MSNDPLLEWVHPDQLPDRWRRRLDPDVPLDDDVVFVPRVVQLGLSLALWFPLGMALFVAGLGILLANASMSEGAVMVGMGIAVSVAVMGVGAFSMSQLPIALAHRKAQAEGRHRFGVFLDDDTVLLRFSKREAALVPRDRVQSTDWTRYQSENAGQAHPGVAGLLYQDDAGELARIELSELTTDGPEGLRRRVAAWAEGEPYDAPPSKAPPPSTVNWER